MQAETTERTFEIRALMKMFVLIITIIKQSWIWRILFFNWYIFVIPSVFTQIFKQCYILQLQTHVLSRFQQNIYHLFNHEANTSSYSILPKCTICSITNRTQALIRFCQNLPSVQSSRHLIVCLANTEFQITYRHVFTELHWINSNSLICMKTIRILQVEK